MGNANERNHRTAAVLPVGFALCAHKKDFVFCCASHVTHSISQF